MDFPAGILNIQTFRKLPTHAPKQKKKTWNISGKVSFISAKFISTTI